MWYVVLDKMMSWWFDKKKKLNLVVTKFQVFFESKGECFNLSGKSSTFVEHERN